MFEQLAHSGAKGGLDKSKLPMWGYEEASIVDDKGTGFRAVLYVPTADALDGGSIRGAMARMIHGGDPPPVLAFRGTQEIQGVKDDLNREGVGTYQMSAHHADVQRLLGQAGGKCIVAGHSLGGALAQLCAARFSSQVKRVVTFQAPAINKGDAKKLKDHNAEHPDEAIESSHYRAAGDMVHTAGEELTPGDVYTFHSAGINNKLDHTQYPLSRLNALRGGVVPGVEGEDRLVGVEVADESVKETKEETSAEADRKRFAKLTPVNRPLEAYKRLWDTVMVMQDAAMPSENILQAIDDNLDVDEEGKDRMRRNLAATGGEPPDAVA